jgi:hypothetical protein
VSTLATGTKLKIDDYGEDRDGISVSSLAEVAFAYMKKYGATKVAEAPGKPQGYEETGSVYEMEADALTDVGHAGFQVDAQAMTALLYDFLTRADYRVKVKQEFDGIHKLFDEYRDSLRKVYVTPSVPDPK